MNIVDAIRIQHFKAESKQRRISSIFFLQNCARYFQQDDVHSLFTLCYAHQVGWQYLFIFYLFQNCARYFQQQDEVKFCLLFVMLTLFKLCKIFSILNNSMRCILCLLFVMLTRWIGNIFLSSIFFKTAQDIFNNKMG